VIWGFVVSYFGKEDLIIDVAELAEDGESRSSDASSTKSRDLALEHHFTANIKAILSVQVALSISRRFSGVKRCIFKPAV